MDRLQQYNRFGELQLLCTFCKSEVKEEERNAENDTRELQKRFNQNMERLRTLISKVDNVELHKDICEPLKPIEIPHLKDAALINDSKRALEERKLALRNNSPFPVDANDPINNRIQDDGTLNWKSQASLMSYETNTLVEILSNAEQRKRHLEQNQIAKEVPLWMRTSTIAGGGGDADLSKNEEQKINNTWDDWYEEDDNEFFEDEDDTAKKPKTTGGGRWATKRNDEVMKTLFQFEKKKDESSDDESSDDDMDTEDSRIIREFGYPHQVFGPYTYEQLLLCPSFVRELTLEERAQFQEYARSFANVSFMC